LNFILSLEREPGKTEYAGMPLGENEVLAREICEERMRTCRENDWPMLTMGLMYGGKLVDTLYRSGVWHSDAEDTVDNSKDA
jgi:hypothetical protein